MTDYYDDSIYEQPETPRQEQEASHQEPEQSMPQMPHTPKKEKKNGKGAVALVLCCALVGGGCGIGGAFIGNSLANKNQPTTVYSDGVSTIMKGVRETSTLQVQQIDSSKVLTGAEVYAANVKGATSITVSTYDGTKYDAQLIGYDESNDVAVLKIDATGLTPVVIGDSDKLNVGDSVVAIGNPLGELTFSETSGIVSALNREVTMSSDTTMDLIQTDCAINSGNSGGALFNMYGEVVGITNAKYSSSSSSSSASIDNIGFAIPINQVYGIVKSIIENGYIEKPFIGVSVLTVSDETRKYGLPGGASVQSVTADSPAEEAGLQINDIITKVNDTEIASSNDLVKLVRAANPGDVLTVTVYRQGKTLELAVTVGRQVQSANEPTATESSSQSSQGYSGFGRFPGWGF